MVMPLFPVFVIFASIGPLLFCVIVVVLPLLSIKPLLVDTFVGTFSEPGASGTLFLSMYL